MMLHVVPSAVRGGVEKNCFHFIRSIPEVQHIVIVLGSDGPMVSEWRGLNAKVEVLDVMKLKALPFRKELRKNLPDERFTNIIVWTNNRIVLVANALNKYRDATLLFHVGNPVGISGTRDKLLSMIFPASNRILIRAVSEYVRQSLTLNSYYRRFPAKVSLKPIEVTEHRTLPPTALNSRHDVRFGIVARLDRMKDHSTVIKAFRHVSEVLPKASLEIGGAGPLKEELQSLCVQLALGDKVTFHGDVADVPDLISQWHVFLYATTPIEGLGGTVPEALAVGLPVVATDMPMIREWDKTGKFIRWCAPADARDMANAALALVADIDHRRFVYENGPAYIRDNFSPKQFSVRYLSD